MQVLRRLLHFMAPLLILPVSLSACSEPIPEGCISFGNPERTNAGGIFVIRESGHYCLTEDLHARIEIADRPAEGTMIAIYVGNVVLDLRGHTLGRGWLFKNPGGHGIQIVDPEYSGGTGLARNITIRNGVLQDFEKGIFFGYARQGNGSEKPTFDPATNTYYFAVNNVTLQNITFKNNKTDFEIRMPPKPVDPNRPRATRYGPDCPQGCRVGRDG